MIFYTGKWITNKKKCPQLYENYTNLEFVDEIGKGSLQIHCTQKHSWNYEL